MSLNMQTNVRSVKHIIADDVLTRGGLMQDSHE